MITAREEPSRPQGYTIGEVANQLKDDFEDVTVSKIRFLENEGLIYPDRTDSGYRIFSDDDADRLRYILTAQRDHYLPLKVIGEQLDRLDAGQTPQNGPKPPPGYVVVEDEDKRTPIQSALAYAKEAQSNATEHEGAFLGGPAETIELGLREFCEATGLDSQQVRALREYSVVGDADDETATFGADDLLTGLAARELLAMGLDPRHLGTYRRFVDNQVFEFEQLTMPLLRQRNPEARRQATQQLERLATLTARLKRSLLSRELRRTVRGT